METPVKFTVSLVAFRVLPCWSLRILISFTPKIGANFFSDTIEGFIVKASVLPYYNGFTQSKKFVTADPALAWQMSCFHWSVINKNRAFCCRYWSCSSAYKISVPILLGYDQYRPPFFGFQIRIWKRNTYQIARPTAHSRHHLLCFPKFVSSPALELF